MRKTIRKTRDDIMGMPITVEVVEGSEETLDTVFSYFMQIDARFSTYKPESEIMQINRGTLPQHKQSEEMTEIFNCAEQTNHETNGFFSITTRDGSLDPSGIVKGWAIHKVSHLIETLGYNNYFIDAGGDIQSKGLDAMESPWTIGIRNPFKREEIVKVLYPNGYGVATSGTSIRGQHIYNPHHPERTIDDIVSMTVIGPNIYEADRFATAAFAMGKEGIVFIENLKNFEGYQIAHDGIATMTSHFTQYTS